MMMLRWDVAPVVAHQYGWDELLLFLVPIALAISGVRYAEKRAQRKKEAGAAQDSSAPSPDRSDG